MKKQLSTLLIAAAMTMGTAPFFAGEAQAAADAVIVSSVNFRTQPNTSSTSLGYLKTGVSVDILSKVNDYWYKVRDAAGRVGYVSTSSKYIKTTSAAPAAPAPAPAPSVSSSAKVNAIIAAGKKYLGTPYEYGSDRSNTNTFDCSDFVRQAFKDGAGITLPSSSRTQGDYVKNLGNKVTNWRNLQPGDLMFFMSYRGGSASNYPDNTSGQTITHVGIYLGDGKVMHTYSKDSGGVRIDSIAGKHWEHRFIFGGSALK